MRVSELLPPLRPTADQSTYRPILPKAGRRTTEKLFCV
ncbi:Unknown protein sequence [Pseudomonas coronafaciens pv. oryzae]|nr:Unknown protein sequence [Pseudomonas coronafaciens pv. oryzae]